MTSLSQTKAFAWALLGAGLSLGLAWGVAWSIHTERPARTAQRATETSATIVSTPELVGQGGQFFQMSCSHCHGDDATGDEGPNLHRLALSDARIATTIRKGIKGEMPSFARKYDDRQIAALVSYLRSLH